MMNGYKVNEDEKNNQVATYFHQENVNVNYHLLSVLQK